MSERTEYAPGTPSWADNASADPATAAEFYSQLFGWETVDRMPPEADGEYHVASLRGKDVAALGSQPMEGVPAGLEHLRHGRGRRGDGGEGQGGGRHGDDGAVRRLRRRADGRVRRSLRGRVHGVEAEPDDRRLHRQRAEHAVVERAATRDVEGSKEFYGKVFGWQSDDMDFGGGTYTVWYPPGVEVAAGQRQSAG